MIQTEPEDIERIRERLRKMAHPEKWKMSTNVVAWKALLEACSVP
jgi:hypothetical protein